MLPKILLSILFIYSSFAVYTTNAQNQAVTFTKPGKFPVNWLGIWKGELIIHKATEPDKKINMELHILPTDSAKNLWKWNIIYKGDKKDDIRNYFLMAIDTAKGIFVLDEKNSILLDFRYHENSFYSVFAVENSLLFSSYELKGSNLFFNITVCNRKNVRKSGKKEGITEVESYPVTVIQQAILNKQ
jgi:hypothetical protein